MTETSEILEIDTHSTESTEDKPDAIYPTERPKSQGGWKKYIEKHINNFEGDVNSAARLMCSYQKGSEYIYHKFSPRFGGFKQPDIMIVLNETKTKYPFGSVENGDKIFVRKSFLEHLSKFKGDEWIEVKRQDGEIAFAGHPDHVFELHGVEETDHSLFSNIKGPQKTEPPDSVGMNKYDAQEIEYRALRWQIQYAVENKMPEKTISILRNRLAKAQEIRLRSENK